jgi:hypothetical protein
MSGGTGAGPEGRGRLVFIGLVLIAGIVALLAYAATGPVGIEDRFASATGTGPHDTGEEGGSGVAGFTLEGQPILYSAVLLLLIIGCFALYRKYAL